MFTCRTLWRQCKQYEGWGCLDTSKQMKGNSIKHAWGSVCHLPSVCQCGSLCVSWDAAWLQSPPSHQTGSAYHQIPETIKSVQDGHLYLNESPPSLWAVVYAFVTSPPRWCYSLYFSERRRASGGLSLEEVRKNMQLSPIDRNGSFRRTSLTTSYVINKSGEFTSYSSWITIFQATCLIPWAQWGVVRPSAAVAALRTVTNPGIEKLLKC